MCDVSSCAIVWRKPEEIVYVQNGNVLILLINCDGLVTALEAENPQHSDYPHLSEVQNTRSWVAYGVDYNPVVKKRKIPPKARWIVIASSGVVESLPGQLLSVIANRAESAVGLAYDLRAAAYAYMVTGNISVIAVDLLA
jgi:serine/threonine protein phosphatase PrpC